MPLGGLRLTLPTVAVLRALLASQPLYGFQLMKETGLQSGTLYPILARLRGAGWITGIAEDVDPSIEHRPARIYYSLTEQGTAAARLAVEPKVQASVRLKPGWSRG